MISRAPFRVPSPYFTMIPMREKGDCAICSLAMLTGRGYAEVMEAACRAATAPHVGISIPVIQTIARALGYPLSNRSVPTDWEDQTGLLITYRVRRRSGHCVYIHEGCLADSDRGEIWPDVEDYFRCYRVWKPDRFLRLR